VSMDHILHIAKFWSFFLFTEIFLVRMGLSCLEDSSQEIWKQWCLGPGWRVCPIQLSFLLYWGLVSFFPPRSWLRIVLVSLADRFGWFVNASILGEIYHLLLTCSLVQLWHFLTHILLKNVMKYDFSWTTNCSNVDIY